MSKLHDDEFVAIIEPYDVVILLETWHNENIVNSNSSTIHVNGFMHFSKPVKKL